MRFSVLSSGSKANCTFIEAAGSRFLIDCGLSAKQTGQRLRALGINPETLDGIIVTHEHRDHICGISVMSRRFSLPVYANEETAEFLENIYGIELFTTGEEFEIGAALISPFSIVHDAADPVGFVVEAEGLKFVQATDLGRVTPLVRNKAEDCNALVLESNYDDDLLQECSYPWELKQRIASTHGHLSNKAAATFLAELLRPEFSHVVLGHLSENSNTPEAAMQTAASHLDCTAFETFLCGSPYTQTPLVEVGEINFKAAV